MKRLFSVLLAAVLCFGLIPWSMPAKAEQWDGFSYTVTNGEVTITKLNKTVNGTLEIPAVIDGYPVTIIDDYAFQNSDLLVGVVIPEGVRSIGYRAFANCYTLVNVTIPNSVLYIGDEVFYHTSKVKYNEHDNGKYLGNEENPYHALVAAKDLNTASCKIHPDTKIIVSAAFGGCQKLRRIIIPDSVVAIGDYAFSGCDAMEYATIGEGVVEIGKNAFLSCDSLTDVSLGSNVRYVGTTAFNFCYKLKYNEYRLGKYLGNEQNPYLVLMSATFSYLEPELIIHPDTKVLSYGVLQFQHLEAVVLLEGLEIIQDYAFYHCNNLTQITIPGSVKEIRRLAFEGCDNLEKVVFQGDAPAFYGDVFKDTTTTAYYDPNCQGWTEDVMQDYGGNVTWMPYEPVAGTTVSGSFTYFKEPNRSIELWQEGAEEASYKAVISDGVYYFGNVSSGSYILKASADRGATREYSVVVTDQEIVLDVQIQLVGDITGDERINVSDTAKAYAYIRGTNRITDKYEKLCIDATGDGKLNVADVARIYAHVRGVNSLW